jgi:hypothetical protein
VLHYYGDITAMALGHQAKLYFSMYEKPGADVVLIPFKDLTKKGRKRYVKFEKMAGQFVFVDLVD